MDSREEGDEFVENHHLAQPGNQFAQTLEGCDLRLKNRRQQQQSEAAMWNEEAIMGRYARLNPCQVQRSEMTDRLSVQRALGLLPVKFKVAPGHKEPSKMSGTDNRSWFTGGREKDSACRVLARISDTAPGGNLKSERQSKCTFENQWFFHWFPRKCFLSKKEKQKMVQLRITAHFCVGATREESFRFGKD